MRVFHQKADVFGADLDELTPVQALNTLYELRTVAEKLP